MHPWSQRHDKRIGEYSQPLPKFNLASYNPVYGNRDRDIWFVAEGNSRAASVLPSAGWLRSQYQ